MNVKSNTVPNPALVVAADTRSALSAIDDALLQSTQLLSSAVAASKTIQVPLNATQELYISLHSGMGAILDGRNTFRKSIAIMRAISDKHGIEMEGCADGWPTHIFSPTGLAADVPA